jgi:hypothetical protein
LFEPKPKSNAWGPLGCYLNPSSSPILETHKKLKELKAIIEVNKKPKREKFLNQSLFEGKNQLSPML